MSSPDVSFLKKVHLIILVLTGIVVPCVGASGAYWGLKSLITDKINEATTSAAKTYVPRDEFKDLTREVRDTHDDVLRIKTLLETRHR